MKQKKRRGWAVTAGLVTLICAVMFVPYFITGKAFILGWDMRTIYSSNFENLRTMVQAWRADGTLPYWSWVNFLGNDFYSSKLFYFNDFFEYFFAFTDLPYSIAIVWMTYLRYLTAALSFYAYCRYNRFSERTSVLGSLLYAFSAYLIQIMRDPFFASFICFLPLYYLSVDRFIREDKAFFFVFMVFFMFFNSYYLFYMTSLFTILYFIWRWKKQYGSLKGMMKEAVILIGYYLVGFLISGVITVPEIFNVLANSRVGERSSLLFYQSIVPYFDYLVSLFTPATIPAYRTDQFSSIYLYDTPNHQLMAAYVWAGSAVALLVPQLLSGKNQDRRFHAVLFAVISAFALIPALNSIMHGFSEPSYRWLNHVTFLLIAMVLPYLDLQEPVDHRLLTRTSVVFSLLLVFSPLVMAWLLKITVLGDGYLYLLICVPFLSLNAWALNRGGENAVIMVTMIELMTVTTLSCYGNPTQREFSREDTDRITSILGAKNYYNTWTLTLDPKNESSFYRNYIDRYAVYFGRGTNYNLDENIMGTMAYDSTYLASTNDLVLLDPQHVEDYLPWTFDITNPDILTLVSARYAVTGMEDPSPFKNSRRIGQYAGTWAVHENLDYINLGKTYRGTVLTYEEYDPSMSARITEDIICHPKDQAEIEALLGTEEVQCYSAHAEGNHVSAGIRTSMPGFAILSVPYDSGWRAVLNGRDVKTYCVNGGLTGLAVEEGENDIQMWFAPRGLREGKYCTALGILLMLGLLVKKRLPKRKAVRK